MRVIILFFKLPIDLSCGPSSTGCCGASRSGTSPRRYSLVIRPHFGWRRRHLSQWNWRRRCGRPWLRLWYRRPCCESDQTWRLCTRHRIPRGEQPAVRSVADSTRAFATNFCGSRVADRADGWPL